MCGISLIVNKNNQPILEERIKVMNDLVQHRGPDGEGFLLHKNFAFGHRLLSIIDHSEKGHQPLMFGNNRIIYNGELYNYIELKNELTNLGYTFNSKTDTEVLLAAYTHWGVDAFKKFNGMWAFVIYDANKEALILCRDNFGMKPLYYTNTSSQFMAASEIKQFIVNKEFEMVLNKKVAKDFIDYGLVNYNAETFFENVYELRAGNYLTYTLQSNKCEIKKWYNIEEEVKPIKDDYKTAKVKIKSLFEESVRLRMQADVHMGSFLSGGVDSSAIVCTIKENNLNNEDFSTVTSCFDNPKYDEQEYSDVITSATGITGHKIYPQLEDLIGNKILEKIIYHLDQPISSLSQFAEYEVCKKSKETNLKVMMDGQGSDEYLCGYNEFKATYLKEAIKKLQFKSISKNLKMLNILLNLKIAIKNRLRHKKIIYFRKHTFYKKYQKIKTVKELSIVQIQQTSLPAQLHSLDRNSMCFSIEARMPFLDKNLVEYCVGLPAKFKIKNNFSKFIFREAIDYVPNKVRFRKTKMAFEAPEEEWMLANKEIVKDELNMVIDKFNFINPTFNVDFSNYCKGNISYNPVFFRLLAFNKFHNVFFNN
jgi:asparagine synthase (glutamine-hydrolysing)